MKKVISTKGAPGAIGPYSQAIEANGFVFVSGQLPIDPETGDFPQGDIGVLTDRAIRNLLAILGEAGLGAKDVVKTTVFLADMADFAAMNEVYAKYFTGECPARSAVQVAKLPKGGRIEIEAIAAR